MEILGNPGVGAASAGGTAAVGVAWDPWAANIRPPPIPVSETPDAGSRPSQGLGPREFLSVPVPVTQTKLEASPSGAYLCCDLEQPPLW